MNAKITFTCTNCGHPFEIDIEKWTQEKVAGLVCPNCDQGVIEDKRMERFMERIVNLPRKVMTDLADWAALCQTMNTDHHTNIILWCPETPGGVRWPGIDRTKHTAPEKAIAQKRP